MSECSFCGKEIEQGTGMMFVKKDGKVLHFCKMKCEKNMFKLKRTPSNLLWTKEGRRAKSERMKTVKK
ncbi:50S ribosomal protein L24e [Candidatus Woesearchaeota archaeon CG10_big_fil_rev_8_21_14_0_10_30_7]|nr:MAG: 50S ribosomal protein L24e [Candidatus Woesearchaeota archaeon CG10_big_fil_rev_8_21_14_0_10_30_7]